MNGIGSVVRGGNSNAAKPAWSWMMPAVENTCSVTCRRSFTSMDVCRARKWVLTSSATHANWHVVHTTNGYLSIFTNGSMVLFRRRPPFMSIFSPRNILRAMAAPIYAPVALLMPAHLWPAHLWPYVLAATADDGVGRIRKTTLRGTRPSTLACSVYSYWPQSRSVGRVGRTSNTNLPLLRRQLLSHLLILLLQNGVAHAEKFLIRLVITRAARSHSFRRISRHWGRVRSNPNPLRTLPPVS